jgi:hypothetical protein
MGRTASSVSFTSPAPSCSVPPGLLPPCLSTPVTIMTRFQTNLTRVLAIQVIALVLLWLLQSRYSG